MGYFDLMAPEKDNHQFMMMSLGPQLKYESLYYSCEQEFSLLKMMATPT